MQPLFPDDTDTTQHPSPSGDFVLDRQKQKRVEPDGTANPAANLIRAKISALYEQEPNAKAEIAEAEHTPKTHRSKHQQFMYELSTSGKPLAHIQHEWHRYYAALPDHEKHEVWREFYAANSQHQRSQGATATAQPASTETHHAKLHTTAPHTASNGHPSKSHVVASQHVPEHQPRTQRRGTLAHAKHRLLQKVRGREQAYIKAKQHAKSLAVGLTFGSVAVFVLLFSFFNEVVIARFIQPSAGASETPIILNTDGIAPSDSPQLIIPKINVQLPIVYDIPSTEEEIIQDALDHGVAHYPTTVKPGERGNASFFGHSSNNIFNSGQYKFAFALLRELVPGDIFYITYEGTLYTYRVYDKRVVDPDETWVLGNAPDKLATATLITCDPPGTTLRRLVVWAEQINPDPTVNTAAAPPVASEATALPAQGPTLWGRLWNWATGS